ncbi:expressed unknown protein [Seminavis robusta]|uniref:t-SNARE coiled-coil homology domain-containing protein n=1 Tax=Seminavis robusta TaxID=568900 RepID=A0A9N8EID6_9STRA|nr:expressed unknown protein [Seminavis robusta]|eukprot:Sro1149_g246580.1 n/a (440) ;mRNA; f:25930-27249
MVPSIRSPSSSSRYYHASHSRAKDWNECCAMVMGFEDWTLVDVVHSDTDTPLSPTNLQVTNLLPSDLFEEDKGNATTTDSSQNHASDPWTKNALNIEADLYRMAAWIQSKKHEFIGFDMDANEASIIQSTVTSFAATTANEIDSLRKMASSSSSHNQVHHRTGIVQILLARLKEDIVEPFGVLQKHRSRKAVDLWQNPLQCKLLVKQKKQSQTKSDDSIDAALGLDDDDPSDQGENTEQQFLPRRDAHPLRNKFMDTYARDETIAPKLLNLRPKSLIRDPLSVLSTETETKFNSNLKEEQQQQQSTPTTLTSTNSNSVVIPGMPDYQYEEMTQAAQEQMHQEALLLQAMVHSDLDSVQKVEQQMVMITKLLTQFSELVTEQSEEVWQIHDTAKDTKENMQQGQEQLADAAAATHQSQHYMAKGIFAMGCLLLMFHWLRP